MDRIPRSLPGFVSVLVAVLGSTAPGLVAQEASDDWKTEVEVGGAVFFGNTSQTTFTSRAATETADSTRELSVGGRFSYGEATDEDGVDFVTQRSWKITSSFDHRPFAEWSPFAFAGLESAFERKIDLRYDFGVGARYLVQRSERGRVDVSLAVLGEETNPIPGSVDPDFDDGLHARWSLRTRARRSWAEERLSVEAEGFYRADVDRIENFTTSLTSSVGFRLNESLSLKLTFLDTYDSEAEARGARTNNDGQVFVTLLGTF